MYPEAAIDNVGGEHLEAALDAAPFGRLAPCGAISMYNATELPPDPRNLVQAFTALEPWPVDATRYVLRDPVRGPAIAGSLSSAKLGIAPGVRSAAKDRQNALRLDQELRR
jgi:hypothetical protein